MAVQIGGLQEEAALPTEVDTRQAAFMEPGGTQEPMSQAHADKIQQEEQEAQAVTIDSLEEQMHALFAGLPEEDLQDAMEEVSEMLEAYAEFNEEPVPAEEELEQEADVINDAITSNSGEGLSDEQIIEAQDRLGIPKSEQAPNWGPKTQAAAESHNAINDAIASNSGEGLTDEQIIEAQERLGIPKAEQSPNWGPKTQAAAEAHNAEVADEVADSEEATGDSEKRTEFKAALADMENDAKTGWDEATGLWKPHTSVEGGSDTIAYGHKLDADEVESGIIMIDGEEVTYADGITEEQAQVLYEEDMVEHQDRAQGEFDSFSPAGDTSWDDLDEAAQLLLTEITYNIGTLKQRKDGKTINKWGWPGLIKALTAPTKDKAEIKKQMRRSGVGKRRFELIDGLIDDWY